jgi:ABC-type multidrug transport system fused ATPase/permease subunit
VLLDDPAAGVLVPVERRDAGVVFQDHRLFPHLSVRDNVAYPARIAGAARTAARAEADGWLARLGLEALAGRRPGQLSGGQAQRVTIARAVYHRPDVLVLDEATSSLDAESERAVRSGIAELLVGRTAVVVAHRLSTVRGADRIVVLEQGRVIEQGTHEQLMSRRGFYWALVSQQLDA